MESLPNKRQQRQGNLDDFFKDDGDEELTRVAFTSRWVAAERAIENARPDGLFEDPFAATLSGASGAAMSERMKNAMPWPDYHITWMAVRTKYIDERIKSFFAFQPQPAQYVCLGAGLDARCYRLDALSAARAAFEVDVPEVVAAFARAMHRLDALAKCPRVGLSADLSVPDALRRALRAAGFDAAMPTFWLLEGLTMYLEHEVNEQLLSQIDALSAPGSHICSGFIADTASLPKDVCPPFTPTMDAYSAMLRAHGWRGTLQADRFGDANLDFGRYPHAERGPDASQCFVLATR